MSIVKKEALSPKKFQWDSCCAFDQMPPFSHFLWRGKENMGGSRLAGEENETITIEIGRFTSTAVDEESSTRSKQSQP
jgi:hypothetical protein